MNPKGFCLQILQKGLEIRAMAFHQSFSRSYRRRSSTRAPYRTFGKLQLKEWEKGDGTAASHARCVSHVRYIGAMRTTAKKNDFFHRGSTAISVGGCQHLHLKQGRNDVKQNSNNAEIKGRTKVHLHLSSVNNDSDGKKYSCKTQLIQRKA